MAWTQVGNLRGPQGPAGPKGPSGSAAKYYGVLRWSGTKYNPPSNAFTRLKSNDAARLVVHKNAGGCCLLWWRSGVSDNACGGYLVAECDTGVG